MRELSYKEIITINDWYQYKSWQNLDYYKIARVSECFDYCVGYTVRSAKKEFGYDRSTDGGETIELDYPIFFRKEKKKLKYVHGM